MEKPSFELSGKFSISETDIIVDANLKSLLNDLRTIDFLEIQESDESGNADCLQSNCQSTDRTSYRKRTYPPQLF